MSGATGGPAGGPARGRPRLRRKRGGGRQLDGEARAASVTPTRGAHGAAVQLDEVADDRKAEAKTAV